MKGFFVEQFDGILRLPLSVANGVVTNYREKAQTQKGKRTVMFESIVLSIFFVSYHVMDIEAMKVELFHWSKLYMITLTTEVLEWAMVAYHCWSVVDQDVNIRSCHYFIGVTWASFRHPCQIGSPHFSLCIWKRMVIKIGMSVYKKY